MSKISTYIIRVQALMLALRVLTHSTGFTFHWEVCSHADAAPMCVVVDQNTCCCSEATEVASCLCSDVGDQSCELSFSKYIQFNFEAQLCDSERPQPNLAFDTIIPSSLKSVEDPPQNLIVTHNSPPLKSGREILRFHSVLVI